MNQRLAIFQIIDSCHDTRLAKRLRTQFPEIDRAIDEFRRSIVRRLDVLDRHPQLGLSSVPSTSNCHPIGPT